MDDLVDLSVAVAGIRSEHHALIEEALSWSPRFPALDPDLLALVCAAAAGFDGDGSLFSWTREHSYGVLWAEVPNFCSRHRCLWPDGVPEAMWDWFGFLHDTGRLDGDPVWELRKPLICYGELDLHGQQRVIGDGLGQLIPCECGLPYRETVEAVTDLLRGRITATELVRELDPFEAIRWLRDPDGADDCPEPEPIPARPVTPRRRAVRTSARPAGRRSGTARRRSAPEPPG